MINLCGTCVHSGHCYGDNDDYSDEPNSVCTHYRRKQPEEPKKEGDEG